MSRDGAGSSSGGRWRSSRCRNPRGRRLGRCLARPRRGAPPRPRRCRRSRLQVIFPRVSRATRWRTGSPRSCQIAIGKRGVTPRLTRTGYVRASGNGVPPAAFWKDGGQVDRGVPLPGDVRVQPVRPRLGSSVISSATSRRQWAHVHLRHARSKNLTPYDVLIIASMVEKETVAPEERGLVAAVITWRAGIPRHRRDHPLREERARHRAARAVGPQSDDPYNTRNRLGLPPTPIGNPGLASIRAAARPVQTSTTSTSSASPTASTTSSPRASRSSAGSRSSTGGGSARREGYPLTSTSRSTRRRARRPRHGRTMSSVQSAGSPSPCARPWQASQVRCPSRRWSLNSVYISCQTGPRTEDRDPGGSGVERRRRSALHEPGAGPRKAVVARYTERRNDRRRPAQVPVP